MAEREVLDEDGVDRLKMPAVIAKCIANGIDLSDSPPIDILKLELKMKLLCDDRNRDQEIAKLHTDYRLDETRREDMRELYIRIGSTTGYVLQMDDPILRELRQTFPDITEKLNKEEWELKKSYAPILVLGETGAGKSSFINLLLGRSILPASLLSNTHVVCEIKYDDTFMAVLHPIAGNKGQKVLSCEEGVEQFLGDLAFEIQRLDDNKKGVYKLAEIYLPLDILKPGVIIVDSPGMGENPEMENTVLDYILNACTFIYVISSDSAGGMQQRMQGLLHKVYEKALNEQRVYQPERAIFICNKWDQVPTEERQAVKKDTVGKIMQYWPSCKESQIFTISTTEAEYMQKHGKLSPKFLLILGEIKKLVPLGREIQILKSYRYLSHFVTRCLHCFGIHLDRLEMTAQDRQTKQVQTIERLKVLREKVHSYFEDQNKALRYSVGELAEKLKDFLREEKNMQIICRFSQIDFAHEKEWKTVAVAIRSKVYDRIMELIKGWEEERGEFNRIGDNISKSLEEEFPKFTAEIFKAQQDFSSAPSLNDPQSDQESLVPDLVRKQFEGLNFGMKIAVGIGLAPVLFLGMAVRLPVFGLKSLKKSISDLMMHADFKKAMRKEEEMILCEKYATSTVKTITDKLELKNVIEAEIQPLFQYLKQQKAKIEGLINSDIELLKQMKEEARDERDIRRTYSPLKEKFRMFQLELENFLFTNMPSRYSKTFKEYHAEFLCEWNVQSDVSICRGLEARIFASKLREEVHSGRFQDVCVRINNEEIKPTNVEERKQVQEAYGLLDKPFMLKLLGITVTTRNHYQIFEPLIGSLRDCLPKQREDFKSDKSWQTYVQELAQQVVLGLDFLHHRSFVHYDLSQDTIGVDSAGSIKLTNINKPRVVYVRPKQVDGKLDLSQYIYIPEKFLFCRERSASMRSIKSIDENTASASGEQKKNYNRLDRYTWKDDMFSVGLLMWEIWVMKPLYGEKPMIEVTDDLMNNTESFRELVSEYRPKKKPHFDSTPDSEDTIMSEWWTTLNGCVNRKLDTKNWLSRWQEIKTTYPELSLIYSSSHFCMSPNF